jgi:hypothetical protein
MQAANSVLHCPITLGSQALQSEARDFNFALVASTITTFPPTTSNITTVAYHHWPPHSGRLTFAHRPRPQGVLRDNTQAVHRCARTGRRKLLGLLFRKLFRHRTTWTPLNPSRPTLSVISHGPVYPRSLCNTSPCAGPSDILDSASIWATFHAMVRKLDLTPS